MPSNRFALPTWTVFRVVLGFLFACHGAANVLGLLGGSQGSGQALEFGLWPGWYAGLIQLVCGSLVVLGLGTRPAALLASGSMAYAYFTVHQPDGLVPYQNGGVSPTLYSFGFLLIGVLGAGPWSLDALLSRRRTSTTAERTTERETVSA